MKNPEGSTVLRARKKQKRIPCFGAQQRKSAGSGVQPIACTADIPSQASSESFRNLFMLLNAFRTKETTIKFLLAL